MSKQKQAESQRDSHKPQVTPSTGGAEQIASPDISGLSLIGGNVMAQASRLSDSRFSITQRQQMAGQIAQIGGNQHMGLVMRAMKPATKPIIQPKLEVNEPGDSYEQEADAVADQVMRMPEPDLARQVVQMKVAPNIQRELSEEEQAKLKAEKDKFLAESFTLSNNVPSTGIGKFDASYDPKASQMKVVVKIFFEFLDSEDVPWEEDEKEKYISGFVSGVAGRWSGQFVISSTKENWQEFKANAAVSVQPTADVGSAHFHVKAHKYDKKKKEAIAKDPSQRSRAEVNNPDDPQHQQATADFYEDDTEMRDSNATRVLNEEIKRLQEALASSGASQINFEADSDVISNIGPLQTFGQALGAANPSAPQIPINLSGSTGEGDTLGDSLVDNRLDVVAMAIARANNGGLQPLVKGKNLDRISRSVTISIGSYAANTNQRRVTDHEFGHMLGLPDEYEAPGNERDDEKHKKIEEEFKQRVTSAGLDVPAMGKDTSSIMSVGVDVMPAHYITIKEALGRMTAQYISDSEWQIEH